MFFSRIRSSLFARIFLRLRTLYLLLIAGGVFYGGHQISLYLLSRTFGTVYDKNLEIILQRNKESFEKYNTYLWSPKNIFFTREWWGYTVALIPDDMSLPVTVFLHANFFTWLFSRTIKVTARITPEDHSFYKTALNGLLLHIPPEPPSPVHDGTDSIKATLAFEGKNVFVKDAEVHFFNKITRDFIHFSYTESSKIGSLPNTVTASANISASHILHLFLPLFAGFFDPEVSLIFAALQEDAPSLRNQTISLQGTLNFHGRINPLHSNELPRLDGKVDISFFDVPVINMLIKEEKALTPGERSISVGFNIMTIKNAHKRLQEFFLHGLSDNGEQHHNAPVLRHIPVALQKSTSEELEKAGSMLGSLFDPYITSKNLFYNIKFIFQGNILDAMKYAFAEISKKSPSYLSHLPPSSVRVEFPQVIPQEKITEEKKYSTKEKNSEHKAQKK